MVVPGQPRLRHALGICDGINTPKKLSHRHVENGESSCKVYLPHFVAYIVEVFMGLKPGQSSGRDGGVYRERGPRGGQTDNYTTIPDNHTAPPTSKPGATWVPVKRTPDSKR